MASYWLAAVLPTNRLPGLKILKRHGPVTRDSVDTDLCHNMTSLGHSMLNYHRLDRTRFHGFNGPCLSRCPLPFHISLFFRAGNFFSGLPCDSKCVSVSKPPRVIPVWQQSSAGDSNGVVIINVCGHRVYNFENPYISPSSSMMP